MFVIEEMVPTHHIPARCKRCDREFQWYPLLKKLCDDCVEWVGWHWEEEQGG
jgi:hypothetical protein